MITRSKAACCNAKVSHVEGYKILHQRFHVNSHELKLFKSRVLRKGKTIFNSSLHKSNDCKRTQCLVDRNLMKTTIYQNILKILNENQLMTARLAPQTVILHSEKGCRQQIYHRDYDPLLVKSVKGVCCPLVILCALEDGTKLSLLNQEEILLERGQILVMDGDVVHAGSSYLEHENTRLHMYLDSPFKCRMLNTTYPF